MAFPICFILIDVLNFDNVIHIWVDNNFHIEQSYDIDIIDILQMAISVSSLLGALAIPYLIKAIEEESEFKKVKNLFISELINNVEIGFFPANELSFDTIAYKKFRVVVKSGTKMKNIAQLYLVFKYHNDILKYSSRKDDYKLILESKVRVLVAISKFTGKRTFQSELESIPKSLPNNLKEFEKVKKEMESENFYLYKQMDEKIKEIDRYYAKRGLYQTGIREKGIIKIGSYYTEMFLYEQLKKRYLVKKRL